MTYDDLVARLLAAITLDPATDDGWQTYLPAIIEQAELRCYRDVDFLAVRTVATVTLAAGVPQFAAPSDWMLGQRISLVLGSGQRVALDRRDDSYLREYSAGTGQPRYWAEPTQGLILLAPTPDQAYTAEMAYHNRPAPLSPMNTTTWLASNAPDLLFYAAAVATTGYLKNYGAQSGDPQQGLTWEGQYRTALEAVLREEGRRKGDNAFDSSKAPPPSSNNPPADKG